MQLVEPANPNNLGFTHLFENAFEEKLQETTDIKQAFANLALYFAASLGVILEKC
jgi:hypothetical protein